MTEYELGSLISEAYDYSSGLFEFWMTLSFAAIVAGAYAGEKLHRSYLRLLAFGYFFASLFLYLVRLHVAFQATDLIGQLEASGYDSTRYDNLFSLAIGLYGQVLHIFGTLGILAFMLKPVRERHE
jgi:uncharacterized membrane protein YfcA